MGLEKLYGNDQYRKTIENLWKNKLRTYRPKRQTANNATAGVVLWGYVTSIVLFDIFVCKINAAEEGRKAESYGKFKIAFLIIYGKLEILLL
jgi:hypothetical protein